MVTTFNPSAKPEARRKAVAKLIAELNADRAPILVGPYRSELGFEMLYWIPFLQWLKGQVADFDTRAAVVTRGGLASLYKAVAHQGYDLFALRDYVDVRRENLYDWKERQKGQTTKQRQVTPWDDAVLEDAAKALGIRGRRHVLHPAWMYWALEPFWLDQVGMAYLASMTDYQLLPKIQLPGLAGLPPRYVAVKCYQRVTFPYPEPAVAEWVTQTVGVLASQCPVVLVGAPGADYDDHVDVPIVGPNIHPMPVVPPEQNLLVQAAILSGATCCVGTYGGVAQWALRLGVPSVSVWHEFGGTAHAHLALSSWLSKRTKVPFLTGSIADAALWAQVVRLPAEIVKQEVAA